MKNGFTLVELIIYIGIVSVMLLAISNFVFFLSYSRIKSQTIAEVEQQGMQVMQIITQTIRNAESINFPSSGATSSELSLEITETAKNQTVFDIFGGTIRITEGINSPIILTSSRLTVSELIFQNLSTTGTPGIIRVQFNLAHLNPGEKNQYDWFKTFYGSASLR